MCIRDRCRSPRGRGQLNMPGTISLGPSCSDVQTSKMASRGLQAAFFGLLRSPRALREPFETPSQHLQHRCCDSVFVLLPCRSKKGDPETLKTNEFKKTSSKLCVFAVFSSSRLWDPILDPLGLRYGRLLALRMVNFSWSGQEPFESAFLVRAPFKNL